MGVHLDALFNLSDTEAVPAGNLVKQMGIRHVRLGIVRANADYVSRVNAFLSASGAKALGITGCPQPLGYYATNGITAADIVTFQNSINGGLEAVEAVNEPDERASADSLWVQDALSCMQSQQGALTNLPYLAPAIGDEIDSSAALGTVASMVTAGNIHRYLSGHNPGTSGFGGTFACGLANSLPFAMCEARLNSGNKPLYVTETGYNSVHEVDLATQAKYLSRVYFVNANAGIVRTYVYCLRSYTADDGFGDEGILNVNLSPKPAYYAIKSLTSILDDSGGASAPATALSYGIAGPATIEHTLMQRADGTYQLALWNETPSWNIGAMSPITVPPSMVGISLSKMPMAVSAVSLTDSGSTSSTPVALTANGFNVPIDDHVSIVSFRML